MDARPTEIGSADAKARFSELLARVEAGETITIRRHGRAVARLVPVTRQLTVDERREGIADYIAWQRENGPRLAQGDNLKEWIDEGRP